MCGACTRSVLRLGPFRAIWSEPPGYFCGTALAELWVVQALDPYQLQVLSAGGVVPYMLVVAVSVCHHQEHPIRAGFDYWISVLHPVFFPAAFVFAVCGSSGTSGVAEWTVVLFYMLLVAGVAGIVASTFPLRGRWWLATVHTVTLAVGAWFWFLGSMTLAHDWI
jgi:hypothetical protein